MLFCLFCLPVVMTYVTFLLLHFVTFAFSPDQTSHTLWNMEYSNILREVNSPLIWHWTCGTRIFLFMWLLLLCLSKNGKLTSSYATTSMIFEDFNADKLLYHDMVVLYCIYFPPFLLHSNTWICHINYKSTSI
jgi:hypothetical protein